jgi:hypothetical protein
LIRKVWTYVAAQLITAAATNAITMIVSAPVSPSLIPSSIARPARYGGASAAPVASNRAMNIRITRPR